MGIIHRLSTLFKANLNDIITRAEDPEKILNQLILDMQEHLTQAKREVAVTLADEKRLKKQLDRELSQAHNWEKKAMMAVRAGRDDLAREALARQTEHEGMAVAYQEQWEMQRRAVDQLRDALRRLNTKLGEAKRRKNFLVIRSQRARAMANIEKTMGNIGDTSAFEALDQLEQRIIRQEAQALASAELAEELSGDTLTREFDDLAANHAMDDKLARLKQKLGADLTFEREEQEEQEKVYVTVAASKAQQFKGMQVSL